MGAYVLVRDQVGHEDPPLTPADTSIQLRVPDVHDTDIEYSIIDLYAVGPESHNAQEERVKPFIHQFKLHGPKGETVQLWGLFDNGALVDAMSTKMYLRVKDRLAPLERSTRCLRMANGSIVTPVGCWKGVVELGGATVAGSFEVFDSSGGWDFLFGKRLMTAFSVIHNYAMDEVFLPSQQCTLRNQHQFATPAMYWEGQPQIENMRETIKGDDAQSPVRGVLIDHNHLDTQIVNTLLPVTTHQQEDMENSKRLPVASKPPVEE